MPVLIRKTSALAQAAEDTVYEMPQMLSMAASLYVWMKKKPWPEWPYLKLKKGYTHHGVLFTPKRV